MRNCYLAADFGGGSGRVMAGFLADGRLAIEEIYRFPNRQIRLGDRLCWDFPALFQEMKNGIAEAVRRGYRVRSIGIDTWGVDFGLVDERGDLLGNPVCYRDERTTGEPERFLATCDAAAHYARTGIQTMAINTLYQLRAMLRAGDVRLDAAHRLLFMPDLLSYYLTGVADNEYTIASTSELLDAERRTWSDETIERAGLPRRLFGPLAMPGTVRGCVRAEIAAELGLDADVKVVAVGSHDTASAAFAAPEAGEGGAFLSSGTWSLLGALVERPVLTEEARAAGFSNEGGVGRICLLQNITGLWIVQRLMAEWEARGEATTYDEVIAQAECSAFDSLIDVDDPSFANPASMEHALGDFCRRTGQAEPQSRGDAMRCVCRSLAARYRRGIDELNRLLPRPVERLNILGGGCRNRLLNRLTAHALGIPVYAGPVEATALGNLALQAIALGDIAREEAAPLIAHSTELIRFDP